MMVIDDELVGKTEGRRTMQGKVMQGRKKQGGTMNREDNARKLLTQK